LQNHFTENSESADYEGDKNKQNSADLKLPDQSCKPKAAVCTVSREVFDLLNITNLLHRASA